MNRHQDLEDLPPVVRKRVRELEPGMVLARPIHSSNGCRLKQAGDSLDPEDVERLRRWKTGTVYVFDPDDSSSNQAPFSQAS